MNEHKNAGYQDGYRLGFPIGLAPKGGGVGELGIYFPDIEGPYAEDDRNAEDNGVANNYRTGFRAGFKDGRADGCYAGGNEQNSAVTE